MVIVSGSNIAGDLEYNIVSVQNGDVNLDGQINIQDVIISVNITLGIYEPSTEQFEMADINNDGIVNVLDIIQLVEHYSGQLTHLSNSSFLTQLSSKIIQRLF